MRNFIPLLAIGIAILTLDMTIAYSCDKDAIIGSIMKESVRTSRNPVAPKKAVKLLIKKKKIDIANCKFEFVLDTIFRPYWIKDGKVFKYKYYVESSISRICISNSYFTPEYKSLSGRLIIQEQVGEKYSFCDKI